MKEELGEVKEEESRVFPIASIANMACLHSIRSDFKSVGHGLNINFQGNIENGLLQSRRFDRYLRLNNIVLILLGSQILMFFLYFELDLVDNSYSTGVLDFLFVLHIVSVVIAVLLERVGYQSLKESGRLSFSVLVSVVKIFVIFLLCPQPWLREVTFQVDYHIGDLEESSYSFKVNYLLLMLGVFWLGGRMFLGLLMNTMYYGPRAKRICRIYQLHHHELYAFKNLFKDQPVKIFSLIFFSFWVLFAFAIRVAEVGVPIEPNHFRFYENCVWFIGTTVTTIGFGDVSVSGDIGYVVVFFCGIWGSFNISVITVLMINMLCLSESQKRSLKANNRMENGLRRKELCGEYIRLALWRLWRNRRKYLKNQQGLRQKRLRVLLGRLRRQQRISFTQQQLGNFMEYEFDSALSGLETLVDNNKYLLSYISRNMFLDSQVLTFLSENETDGCANNRFSATVYQTHQKEEEERKVRDSFEDVQIYSFKSYGKITEKRTVKMTSRRTMGLKEEGSEDSG